MARPRIGDLGRNASEVYFRYSSQKVAAGRAIAEVADRDAPDMSSWKGNSAASQAQWFLLAAAGRVGVAIWDAQDSAAAWRSAPVWQSLKAVRADTN